MADLLAEFQNLDIYLFDQVQKGRIRPGMSILDVGCGSGRNLSYFLRAGFDVYAADEDPRAIAAVCSLAGEIAPRLPADNFRVEPLDALTFPDESVDFVISTAVLHFARDHDHFQRMLLGSWRPLRTGGLFFCRLASSIGIERQCEPLGDGRFRLPNGQERYLVDEQTLHAKTDQLSGVLADPLKTTLVHGQRSMTTWVLRKTT
jgi:SAM-dependent methyltransferase